MNWNFDRKHLDIAKVLVETIKEGQLINSEKIITYGELGSIVALPISTYEEREIFGRYLGELSCYCNDNDMPLISAMVIRKSNNYNSYKIDIPGNGFYKLYKDLRGIEVKSKEEKAIVFYKELKLIKEYENWDELTGLLENEIYPRLKPISGIKKKKILLPNKLNKKVEFIEINEFIDIEDIAIEEGRYIETLIKAKKRNSKARKIKVEQFKKDNDGKVFCEVCKEDDEVVLDVHHDNVEVCNMEEGHLTKLSDLRILCSNCHRKVHGYKITVEELIESIN
ncbi:hypothetical protein TPELB_35610 [Terrisporobacter petrolearius]|uniref:HNH endonuclease n=1 Tax=Terrisporobacter petrolearius TaxID=1460447 RepID=A0ABZ3FHC9_9FIRM